MRNYFVKGILYIILKFNMSGMFIFFLFSFIFLPFSFTWGRSFGVGIVGGVIINRRYDIYQNSNTTNLRKIFGANIEKDIEIISLGVEISYSKETFRTPDDTPSPPGVRHQYTEIFGNLYLQHYLRRYNMKEKARPFPLYVGVAIGIHSSKEVQLDPGAWTPEGYTNQFIEMDIPLLLGIKMKIPQIPLIFCLEAHWRPFQREEKYYDEKLSIMGKINLWK